MPIVPKAGWYAHWHPPVVNDLFVTMLFLTVFHVVLVVGAIVFRIQKVFNKTFIHFVHWCSLLCVARCLTP